MGNPFLKAQFALFILQVAFFNFRSSFLPLYHKREILAKHDCFEMHVNKLQSFDISHSVIYRYTICFPPTDRKGTWNFNKHFFAMHPGS